MRLVLGALLALALAVPVSATDFFTMACGTGGASYPLCGFSSEITDNYGTLVNRTRRAVECPDNTDAVRFEFIVTGTHSQFYYGWNTGTLGGWNPGPGDTFYLKYRIKPDSTLVWTGNAPEDVFYMKFILFTASVSSQRLITNLRDAGVGVNDAAVESMLNVGGGPGRAFTVGSWNHVIQGFTLSTTASSNDGVLKTWSATSGTLNVAAPDATNSGLDIEDDASRTGFYVGHLTQTTLGSGGDVSYDVCNVVLTDTFDANWPTASGGGGDTGNSTKVRVRITPAAGGLLAVAAFGLLLRRKVQ